MTIDEFLRGLKSSAADSSVQDTINLFHRPPGRRPAESLLKLAKWYSTLDATNQELLREALRFATDTAIFGVLCILDGARVIEDAEEKGEFELYYVKGHKKQLLNPPSDPLHETYREFMDNS